VSKSKLPERASLEYLKKLAKDRLQERRRSDPQTKLADVLLSIARDYGFPSWRALKTEIEQRETGDVARFFDACEKGDADGLRGLLAKNPSLVRAENPKAQDRGWTGLHASAKGGHVAAVRLLLKHGADPNAREAGDNTCPLHWAAASKDVEVVRVLLDAGGDARGSGDLHDLDVIGWAAVYGEPFFLQPATGKDACRTSAGENATTSSTFWSSSAPIWKPKTKMVTRRLQPR